jgi:hypothetical protein
MANVWLMANVPFLLEEIYVKTLRLSEIMTKYREEGGLSGDPLVTVYTPDGLMGEVVDVDFSLMTSQGVGMDEVLTLGYRSHDDSSSESGSDNRHYCDS